MKHTLNYSFRTLTISPHFVALEHDNSLWSHLLIYLLLY